MHQLPRPSPRSVTPATPPATDPERTNNSRDPRLSRSRSSQDLASYAERAGAPVPTNVPGRNDGGSAGSQDRELTKLNQIIQHFHTKAALMVCSSRANLPKIQNHQGDIRQNRWFNIVIDETDVLAEHMQEWKRSNLCESRPRPLVIEIFLDTAHLTNNQVLVIKDEAGRRFNVADALASLPKTGQQSSRNGVRHCEVILERWNIELGDPQGYSRAELDDNLPNVYKKGVVLFRSLYTFLRMAPAFKLHRKLLRQTGSHQAPRLKFRIRKGLGPAQSNQLDHLSIPLYPSENTHSDTIEHHAFSPLVTPVGPLCCSFSYRKNCVFGVADAEALISDQFYGLDERMPTPPVGRSLPDEHIERQYSSTVAPAVTSAARERPRAMFGAYGSLGTFHAPHRRGSPVSELRQRALEDDEDVANSKVDNATKRRSVDYITNPPFKAGSLTSSPRPLPSPGSSYPRSDSSLTRPSLATASYNSKRSSLNTTLPQQRLRTPSLANDVAVASPSSASPRPVPSSFTYSSSFANRTRRMTSQSGKAAGSSNVSSGRGSSESKEKGDMNEGSGGSARTDDDDIASFISELEKSKDMKFHTPPGSSRGDNVVINLSKYSNMRDPSTQLAEEMSSSSLIQTSSTPPSRRLSNVPGLSTSSSPSRALAHAPHVRSRLSTHSVVDQESGGTSALSGVSGEGSGSSPRIREVEEEDDDEPFIFPHHRGDDL